MTEPLPSPEDEGLIERLGDLGARLGRGELIGGTPYAVECGHDLIQFASALRSALAELENARTTERRLRVQMLEIGEHAGAHLCRAEKAEAELERVKGELTWAQACANGGLPCERLMIWSRAEAKAVKERQAAQAQRDAAIRALEEIRRVGDGFVSHDPPHSYAGTTGDGHARCREIAARVLANLKPEGE